MECEELILVNAQVSAIAALPKPPLGLDDGRSPDGSGVRERHDAARRWPTTRPASARRGSAAAGSPPASTTGAACRPVSAIEGPAIVEQLDTTTFLGLGDRARVDDHGNLVVEVAR